MADSTKKVTIKQKSGSDKITILPHTSADIVSVSSLTVEGTTVTNVQDALEELAANNGLVRRVNGQTPASADGAANSGTLKGDVTINAGHIYLGANIPANGATVYDKSTTTVDSALAAIHGRLATVESGYVTSVNGQSPSSGAVSVYGTQIPATNANGAVSIIESSTSKINMSLIPDYLLGQVMYGGTVSISFGATTPAIVAMNLTEELADLLEVNQTNSSWFTVMSAIKNNQLTSRGGVYFIIGANAAGPYEDKTINFTSGSNNNSLAVFPGDWIIYDGGDLWNKIDNSDAVSTVNGYIGAVTLNSGNVPISAAIGGTAQSPTYAASSSIQSVLSGLDTRLTTLNTTVSNLPAVSLTTTAGSEKVTVGSNSLNVATRDTAQTISGAKTFTGAVKIEGNNLTVGKSSASKNIVLYSTGTASKTATIAAPANTDNVTVTLPTSTGTVATKVRSGLKADGTTYIDASAAASGLITLGDSGVTAGTYCAVQVNAKGIVVNGGHVIKLLSAESGSDYNSVFNGGFYFLEDAAS